MDTPNLAGFRAAREAKRQAFSEPVVLLGPVVATYPAGTPMDPEQGVPYDPTIAPTSSAQASALIDAEWVWRSSQDPSDDVPIGTLEKSHPMLIAGSAASAIASGMKHFVGRGERYQIEGIHFDGITGIDRVLIYGART